MQSPTFSVGIPTYNQAEFLEETIQSLLHQTRPPDEIVISDHYSTDDTPNIIRRYAGRVRGVQPPRNVNLSGQYDFTLNSQDCDWITLLSSDDLARPNYCEALVRGAASREDAVLVRAGWENIDAQGKTVSYNYMLSVPKVEAPPATLLSQKMGPKASFAAFALRRDAYLRSGPILESLESLSDCALFLQVAPFGTFIYEHELISGYRVGHDGNKFRNRFGMWIRDLERIYSQVMPLAARRAGLTDLAWIDEAAKLTFQNFLAAAEDEFRPSERAEVVPQFQSWAKVVDGQPLLDRFARGEVIRPPASLGQKARSMLRPFAQRLTASWQRR